MARTNDPAARAVEGSFRDPSGFVFESDGRLLRQVNRSFAGTFDGFVQSGLYDRLVRDGLLVAHEEVPREEVAPPRPELVHKIIEPERVAFVSYPYEWCFSQLKDAALTTLAIQRVALEHGHSLRDCSAFNIQFHRGRPILIDTLSFEPYREGEPWVAYRQFCQHFLAPLALIAHADGRLGALARLFIDGTPLDLAARLLPRRTWLSPTLLVHIHVHARTQRRYAAATAIKRRRVGRMGFLGLIDSLASAVERLRWGPTGTEWGDYYRATSYTDEAMQSKVDTVSAFLERVRPAGVWDLGANTGVFSRLASDRGLPTVAFDIDPAAVEKNYLYVRAHSEAHLLPLVIDLTNPSPALGWDHRERASLAERGPADLVLVLALVHHLAISNNVPLARVAAFLARIGRHLAIEFIPKGDSQAQRLLATREDIFPDYDMEGFETAFAREFTILDRRPVAGSQRTLYLMRRRSP